MTAGDLMRRRAWNVSHSKDGFALAVYDRWLPGVLAEDMVNTVLAALGHPCCGRGLGRIPVVGYLAYRFLNAPNVLLRRDKRVILIPLTVEQALTLQPNWKDDWMMEDGTDEYGYTWKDAVMIGVPEAEA